MHVVLVQIGSSSMKKLSDFQSIDKPRTSISEGMSLDVEENSLSEHSNSQNSLEEESMDDSSSGLTSNRTNQIIVKVI